MENLKLQASKKIRESSAFRHKQQTEKDALQKMFLVTEPAFKKMKENLDAEKHLGDLDKQLRTILFDKKLPSYKKWLHYHNLLNNFKNFKRILEETKNAKDEESLNKLKKLEQRIIELEAVQRSDEAPHKEKFDSLNRYEKSGADDDSINIVESTRLGDPSMHEDVFENDSTSIQSISSDNPNIIDELASLSPEKIGEHITVEDEDGEKIEWEPPKFIFQDEDEKMQKILDDELISNETVFDRIENLPPNLRNRVIPTGSHPLQTMNVQVVTADDEDDSKYKLQSINVDPKYMVLTKDNYFKVKTSHQGWVHIPLMMPDDFKKIRNWLITKHQSIASEIDKYQQQRPLNVLQSKNYSISNFDDDSKILKYKNEMIKVPNTIIDDTIKILEKNKTISLEELRQKIEILKKQQKNRNMSTFSNPLNTTAFETPYSSSTPARKNLYAQGPLTVKRKLFDTLAAPEINQSLRQSSLHESFRTVKNPNKKQKGKGIKLKWAKI